MSKIWKLKLNDFIKGLIVAVGTGALTCAAQMAQMPQDGEFNIGLIISAGISAGVIYIGKNFVTDENGKVVGKFDLK